MKVWIGRNMKSATYSLVFKNPLDSVHHSIRISFEFLQSLDWAGAELELHPTKMGEMIPMHENGQTPIPEPKQATQSDPLVHTEPNQNEDGTIGDTGRFL